MKHQSGRESDPFRPTPQVTEVWGLKWPISVQPLTALTQQDIVVASTSRESEREKRDKKTEGERKRRRRRGCNNAAVVRSHRTHAHLLRASNINN